MKTALRHNSKVADDACKFHQRDDQTKTSTTNTPQTTSIDRLSSNPSPQRIRPEIWQENIDVPEQTERP